MWGRGLVSPNAGWVRLGFVLSGIVGFAGSYWTHGKKWDDVSNLAVNIHWQYCGENPDTFALNAPMFGYLCQETYNTWRAARRVEVWEWTVASFMMFALCGVIAYALLLLVVRWIVHGFSPDASV
jgi:hypothetical protein